MEFEQITQAPVLASSIPNILATPTLSSTAETPLQNITQSIPLPTVPPVHVTSAYQFSAFTDAHLGTPPPLSELPFTVQAPKLTWKSNTLQVRFALQYIKGDQESQQGRIIILARSPESLHAYPNGILNLPGKTTLISPENGEFFSVSRFREVKAFFGPLNAQETISSVEVYIFDSAGKILVYQALTPSPKTKSVEPPIDEPTESE